MHIGAVQQFVIVFLSTSMLSTSKEIDKDKRSPLEHGYVEFALPTHVIPKTQLHVNTTNLVTVTKSEKATVAVPLLEPESSHSIYKEVWVPGHVVHHSYIPAHLHHLIIPHQEILVKQVHTTVVSGPLYHHSEQRSDFRKHLGGFGVGVDFGGPGAGHGFQISLG